MPQRPAVGLGGEGPRSEQGLEVTQYSRHRGACGIFLLMVVCGRSAVLQSVTCAMGAWERSGAEAAEWSEHAEALAALADGQLQHLVHLFIRVIRWEAQLVKTRVCGG